MTVWVFSHCPADRLEGDDGCAGCPGTAKADGTPAAENCEAVFVAAPRPKDDQPGAIDLTGAGYKHLRLPLDYP